MMMNSSTHHHFHKNDSIMVTIRDHGKTVTVGFHAIGSGDITLYIPAEKLIGVVTAILTQHAALMNEQAEKALQ
jgi:hypothetical protein